MIVVGDRLLIEPSDEARTHSGLYLPAGSQESDGVRSGKVLATGPGVALPHAGADGEDEPWKEKRQSARFIPMQVEAGDEALFFKKAAVEIRYDSKIYLVVPQSAVLIVIRP
ncbi:MAG: co-chaperone GroES [Planctomycetes bacterium]|nr:co-chaperone GroES [Planctomycetota bacterium]